MDIETITTYCQKFIKIPGETGLEKDAADFLKNIMEELDFDEVSVDDWGNVIGTIEGNGSQNILLEGHLDTVGIGDPALWSVEPYAGVIRDGRLYGRGASDMRTALMTMVLAAAALIPERDSLKGNISVAGIVCEETFEGVAFGKVLDVVQPDLVILGEASELHLNIGQRGRAEIQVITFGKSAHSANPDAGINAVKQMMQLCPQIDKLSLGHDELLGPAILELTDIRSEPYPGKSVIPEKCIVTYDRRLLPGETEESVLQPIQDIIARLQEQDPAFKAEAKIVEAEERCYTDAIISGKRFFPAWKFPPDASFIQTAQQALKQSGLSGELSHYAFCTDGSQSAGIRGIPTLGFGPSRENLAHVVDEYVELEQLVQAYHGYIEMLRAILKGANVEN